MKNLRSSLEINITTYLKNYTALYFTTPLSNTHTHKSSLTVEKVLLIIKPKLLPTWKFVSRNFYSCQISKILCIHTCITEPEHANNKGTCEFRKKLRKYQQQTSISLFFALILRDSSKTIGENVEICVFSIIFSDFAASSLFHRQFSTSIYWWHLSTFG